MCLNGVFVAIELKKDAGAHIDKLQKYKLSQISQAGGIALVVHPENWETAYQFLQQIAHKGYNSLTTPPKETAAWDSK